MSNEEKKELEEIDSVRKALQNKSWSEIKSANSWVIFKVIAEFVETKKMYHALREAKIDFVQGWAVSKPYPLAELKSQLKHLQRSKARPV